jgi:lysozyme
MMRTSDAGRDLIKRYEGLRLDAYLDAASIPTIGYGHTGPRVALGQRITETEADRLLANDLLKTEADLLRQIKRPAGRPLTQAQFDALVSFHFNTGGFRPGTGIYRAVNAGNDQQVDDELRRWVHATVAGKKRKLAGLVRRRDEEAALWLSGCEQSEAIIVGDATSPAQPNDRPVATHPGVASAGAITSAAVLADAARQLEPLAGYSEYIKAAFLVLSLFGIAWTFWHAWVRR